MDLLVYLKSKEVFVLAKVTSPQVPGLFFKVECGTCCNKSDKSRAVLQATAAKSLSLPLARFVFPSVGLAGGQTEALASCAGLRALREEEDGLLVGFLPHPAGLIAQLVGAYG